MVGKSARHRRNRSSIAGGGGERRRSRKRDMSPGSDGVTSIEGYSDKENLWEKLLVLEGGSSGQTGKGCTNGCAPVDLRSEFIIHVQDKLLRIKKNSRAAAQASAAKKKAAEMEEMEGEDEEKSNSGVED